MSPAPARPRLPLAVEAPLACVVATFAVVFAGLHQTLNRVHPPATLERLCSFTAELPYQNRVLVPALLRGLGELGLWSKLGVSELAAARWIEIACLIVWFYALRVLLGRFLPGRFSPSIWALVGLAALPFLYIVPRRWPYWYPWDVPALLFTTLGLLWIAEQRWSAYYWLLPFATLNRETTCFLVVAFALTQQGRMKRWTWLEHLAAQVFVWWAITRLIGYTFAKSPGIGEFYADALVDNLAVLKSPATWGVLALAFGGLWLPLLFFARFIRERFVRRALWVVPLFFAVALKYAQLDELRIYGEVLPFVVLGVACGASGWRARQMTSDQRGEAAKAA